MATKKELIEMLSDYSDDDTVIIMDRDGGWCNIGDVHYDGSINIVMDDGFPVFSSE